MFTLYRSNRLDLLADRLADVLQETPLDPMQPEIISVQSRSMEAWLRQSLCERLDVFANADFPFPRALVESTFESVLGESYAAAPKLNTEELSFRLFYALPKYLHRPTFSALAAYVENDKKGTKRFQLCEKIANIFDQYAVFRPNLVKAWEAGQSTEAQAWQTQLWNDLIRDAGLMYAGSAFMDFVRALPLEGNRKNLPKRITIFGISTLPPLYLSVLNGLSPFVEIGLFLLSPSAKYWAHIQNQFEIRRRARAENLTTSEAMEELHLEIGNPLLAKYGDTGRDFQQILDAHSGDSSQEEDLFAAPTATTLLAALQSDIFELRDRRIDNFEENCQPIGILPDDQSLSIHACHGAMREVEVMRDHVREALEADPKLSPHDIVVMSPDFDSYAPLIEAVFSAHHRKTPEIPFSISDQSARDNAPVIQAFIDLLRLSRRRLTIPELLDLLALEPVRERFRIEADEIEQIRGWMIKLNVRWGRDDKHRAQEDQPALMQNTWRAALNQLLLGYAYAKPSVDYFAGVLPYTDLQDEHWELLGRFSHFVDRLFFHLEAFDAAASLSHWVKRLHAALDEMASSRGKKAKQHQYIRTQIASLCTAADGESTTVPLDLEIIRSFLESKLAPSSRSAGDMSGGVVFCAMLPMRSIPFRVVGLMGMNDRDFPRDDRGQGFNLIHQSPMVGDRSVRKDDRYLFLEAVLSAQERLIITYTGQGVRRNETLPPSVVVSDLLDTVRGGFFVAESSQTHRPEMGIQAHRKSVEDRLVVRHKLQAFHQDYFDKTNTPKHFSYSPSHCEAALSLRGERPAAAMFLSDDEVLGENQKPPQDQNHCDTIELEQFLRFWTHPPEYLLNQVLALRFPKQSESIEEREPFVLNGLERYALGDAILQGILRGRNENKIQKDIRASGQLPFGGFGDFTFAKTFDEASALAQMVEAEQFQAFDDPVYVNIPLSKGHLRGALTQVGPSGILDFGFARVGSKQMLRLWIRHLCLCASTDASAVSQKSVHIGRGKDGDKRTRVCFGPIDNPKETLESLVTLFLFGSSRALPFFPKSSAAYATKMVTPTLKKDGTPRGDPPSDALRDARKAWNDTMKGNKVIIEGEWRNAAIQRLFGTEAPFDPGDSKFIEITLAVFRPLLENWIAQ